MNKNDINDDIIYEEDGKKSTKNGVPSRGEATKKVADDARLDDDSVGQVVMEDESEAPEALVKKLKEKIKTLEKEKQEYMNGWQRERADFINYKKRVENEKVEVVKYANENLVEEIIPILDSFEMAFSNKELWEKVDKNWRVGVEYIHSQILKILDENGFKQINPQGEKFDPKFHVAEEHVSTTEEKQDGIITEVKKKGYMLNDRVIKASQVVVAEYKEN